MLEFVLGYLGGFIGSILAILVAVSLKSRVAYTTEYLPEPLKDVRCLN